MKKLLILAFFSLAIISLNAANKIKKEKTKMKNIRNENKYR